MKGPKAFPAASFPNIQRVRKNQSPFKARTRVFRGDYEYPTIRAPLRASVAISMVARNVALEG